MPGIWLASFRFQVLYLIGYILERMLMTRKSSVNCWTNIIVCIFNCSDLCCFTWFPNGVHDFFLHLFIVFLMVVGITVMYSVVSVVPPLPKRGRNVLSILYKLEIVQWTEKGWPMPLIMSEFNIRRSVVHTSRNPTTIWRSICRRLG